jgi:peptidoglycan lytic transglycosylase D
LGKLLRHYTARGHFVAAGVLATFILPHSEWCLSDALEKRANHKPIPPMSAGHSKTDLLQSELRVLVNDLGVPADTIPSDFVEKVRRWARLYQTRDRDEMELVLGTRRNDFQLVRQQVESAGLPADLAFATLVESHFQSGAISADDNAGLWQFTRDTARRNGLKVNTEADERLDPRKSTDAACRYLQRLRHQLGPESSLMLALAAYNMGPGRLAQRTRHVADVAKRQDFWYLYRTHVLPAVTRTHLARLMAAILIGRDPEHFGFKPAPPENLEAVSSPATRFDALDHFAHRN